MLHAYWCICVKISTFILVQLKYFIKCLLNLNWNMEHLSLTLALNELLSEFECVQNQTSCFITSNYRRTSGVTTMKTTFSLPLPSYHRKISRLCLFCKIYYNSPLFKSWLLITPRYISGRIDHLHKAGVLSCHTKHCFYSYVPSTCESLNSHPRHAVDITYSDINTFKATVCSLSL